MAYFKESEFRKEWTAHMALEDQARRSLARITERFFVPICEGYIQGDVLQWAQLEKKQQIANEGVERASKAMHLFYQNGNTNIHAYVTKIVQRIGNFEWAKWNEAKQKALSMDEERGGKGDTGANLHEVLTSPHSEKKQAQVRIAIQEIRERSELHGKVLDALNDAPPGRGVAYVVMNLGLDYQDAHKICQEIAEALTG